MARTEARLTPYLILAGALFVVAGLLALYAWQVGTAGWEVDAVRRLQESGPSWLRPVSIGLAVAGTGIPWFALVAALAIALWMLGGFRLLLLLAGTATLQDVGAVIKIVVECTRPAEGSVDVWRTIGTYSFPSGHVLGATLVFGFLFFAVEHCALSRLTRRLIQAGCVAWMLLMGLGRMELGAHWPTDVLGGYVVGALLLLPVVFVLRQGLATPRSPSLRAA